MISLVDRSLVVSAVREPRARARVPRAAPASSRPATGVSAGVVASVVFHAGVALAFLSLVSLQKPATPKAFLSTPRLVSVVYLPSPTLEIATLELPKLRAAEEVLAPEPVVELPPVVPVRPSESVAIDSPVVRPVPAIAEAPKTPPPAPAPPKPTVGMFPGNTVAARAPEPARRVEAGGFDLPTKQTVESRLGQPAAIGAFDSAPTAGTRQGGAATAVVAESGFARSAVASTSSQEARVVSQSGFGDTASRERPQAAAPAQVKQAGFANALATEAPRRVAETPAAPAVTAVQVIAKPMPLYTDQARKLKIEGDVVLEVEFSASGSLRVVRVVRGLGYGLDESAVKAAEQIQFKPAISQGRAVDSRANVHIVFRIT
jgi:TonB family protein